MSSHSSRRASSRTAATEAFESAGSLAEAASAPAEPAGSGMWRGFSGHFNRQQPLGAHIRYTEWLPRRFRERLRRLRAEVEEEAHHEQILIALRGAAAVDERRLAREVVAIFDSPDEVVSR